MNSRGRFYGASVLGLAAWLACSPGSGHGQSPAQRMELGERLRAFERAWDKEASVEARRKAVKPLQQATTAFFSLRVAEAARHLDEARFALLPESEVTPAKRWAESLQLSLKSRLVDVAGGELEVTVSQLYMIDPAAEKARVQLDFSATPAGKPIVVRADVPLGKPTTLRFSEDLAQGEYALALRIVAGDRTLAQWTHGVSLVRRRDERIAGLARADERGKRTTDAETLRELRSILGRLARGETLETHYPAALLLEQAEQLAEAIRNGKAFHGWPRHGEFWLRLGTKSTPVVRLAAPAKLERERPVPLVIALHGAGGSENMFFDGYGDGLIARLCAQRGWLLAAPRSGLLSFGGPPLGEIIDEIGKLYPVDRNKVFLVGHSMGAGQALGAAQSMPENVAAVAALGGGRAIKVSDKTKAIAFFVAAGKQDFALSGARSLGEGLKKAGVPRLRHVEYDDIEHLVVVQHALPEVFAFFDEVAKATK